MKRVPNEALDYTDDDLYYYEGELFTGTSYFQEHGDSLKAEHEYRGGMRWGLSKGWATPGCLEYEEQWSQGLLHGQRREWYRGGRLAVEEIYEYGTRVSGKRWDEDGNLVEDFRLKETDPNFGVLEMYRAAYKKSSLDE